MKKGEEIDVKIDGLVFGGRGIGDVEGLKIFVPHVAPGDVARVRVGRKRSSYVEGRLLEIIEESPRRIPARCKHFDTCGGCKWQFISYEDQCSEKEQQVRDAVERIGELNGDLVQQIIPCETAWYYRNKMELSFGPGSRIETQDSVETQKEPDRSTEDEPMLGFYPPRFHYEVFDLEECFLQSDWMAELVAKVRDFVRANDLHHYNSKTGDGFLRTLTIREGKNTGEVMVILTTKNEPFPLKDEFVSLFDERVTSIYWTTIKQEKGSKTEIVDHHLAGKSVLTEALILQDLKNDYEKGQRLEFDILPQAFFQTNTKQAEVLYSEVIRLAELSGNEMVFDLYCGTGTIGLFCAHKAKEVIGIDINSSAIENARSNAEKNSIKNARYICGSVDDQLEQLNEKPDVVIVDPPRSGLGEKVVHTTAAFAADRIIYVSCNPTTLARDLKFFAERGYLCQSVQPVDMFPQTYHVENICLLTKASVL